MDFRYQSHRFQIQILLARKILILESRLPYVDAFLLSHFVFLFCKISLSLLWLRLRCLFSISLKQFLSFLFWQKLMNAQRIVTTAMPRPIAPILLGHFIASVRQDIQGMENIVQVR